MATAPPWPSPLGLWARAALYLAPLAFAAGEALVDHLSEVETPGELQWRRAIVTAARSTPGGTSEDHAQIHFDIVNMTAGEVDTSWIAADYEDCEDQIKELCNVFALQSSSICIWDSIRWYAMAFETAGSGFAESGDAVRVTPINYPGSTTTTDALPYQVACSITFKTALRKHWGRIYVPNFKPSTLDGYGRWEGTGTLDPLVAAFATRFGALQDAGFVPVVASAATKTLFSITDVQVDDIPDVQRRRRARTTLLRKLASEV